MTRAEVLAVVAAVLAAAGLVELAATRRRAARRPRGRLGGVARRLSAALGMQRLDGDGPPARVEAAGLAISGGELLLARFAAAALVMLLILMALPPDPSRLGFVVLIVAPPLAMLVPDLWLRRRVRARAARLESEQADVLDLLRVAVGAGMAPWQSVAEVGRRHPGLLAYELGRAARQVALGIPSAQALARLERRCPAAGMHALCTVLARTDRLGASPGRGLNALAVEARARQARRAAERAAKAGPKIQLVVALLLVPSVLLLVAAALIPAVSGGGIG